MSCEELHAILHLVLQAGNIMNAVSPCCCWVCERPKSASAVWSWPLQLVCFHWRSLLCFCCFHRILSTVRKNMCCFSLNVLSLWLPGRLRRQRCGFQAAVPPVTGWHQGQQAGDESAALCRPGKHPQRVYGMLTGAWRLAPYYVIQELEQNSGVKVLYSCLNLLFVLVWVVLWCFCLRSNLIIFMELMQKDILFGDLWCFFGIMINYLLNHRWLNLFSYVFQNYLFLFT